NFLSPKIPHTPTSTLFPYTTLFRSNQYVYGTGIPQYSFHASVEATPDGKTHVKGELTRSGVPDTWKDAVPLYAHMGDKTVRLGTLGVTHSSEPVDITLAGKVDRVSINDYEDLLADVKQCQTSGGTTCPRGSSGSF